MIEPFPQIIKESFNNFISNNNITYPNLTHTSLSQWHFESDINNKFNLPQNALSFIQTLPSLGDFLKTKTPSLIKAHLTSINTIENQFYISAYYNKTSSQYEPSSYFSPEPATIPSSPSSSPDIILSDRLLIEVIPTIGLNSKLSEALNGTTETASLPPIYLYDYSNTHSKINQNLFILGTAYSDNEHIYIHAWTFIPNVISLIIESKYLSMNITPQCVLPKLKTIIKQIFYNDTVVSEYIYLYLFSQIFIRVGTKNIGSLPLNIIFPDNTHVNNNMLFRYRSFISKVALFTKEIEITIDKMNTEKFYSVFNVENDVLERGTLQLCDTIYLLLNEFKLKEGKLLDIGCKNFNTVKHVIEFQSMKYEYPYNSIEIQHDMEVLVFTQNKKSLFASPFLCVVPLDIGDVMEEDGEGKDNEMEVDDVFYYVNYIRLNKQLCEKFIISKELGGKINKDYMSRIEGKFNVDKFDLVLRLARLYAISQGRNELTFEDYEYVFELEKERMKRLEAFEKSKVHK